MQLQIQLLKICIQLQLNTNTNVIETKSDYEAFNKRIFTGKLFTNSVKFTKIVKISSLKITLYTVAIYLN